MLVFQQIFKINNYILALSLLLIYCKVAKAQINFTSIKSFSYPQLNNQQNKFLVSNYFLAQNQSKAEKLYEQGNQQYQDNQIELAIKSWQQALEIYRQEQDNLGTTVVLSRLGLAVEAQENYSQAVDYFQQALTVVKQTENQQLKASILGNLGNNYLRLSNYPQALESYQASLVLWQELGNIAAEGLVLRGLGNVQIALGNYDKALDFHQQSLEIARSFDDTAGLIYSYNSIGAIYANQGNYSQAIQNYQQSLDTIQNLDNFNLSQKLKAQTLNNLASSTHAQMNYSQSLDYYQQSLELAEQNNFPALKGIIVSGMGSLYLSLDDFTQAKTYLEQGLVIAQQSGDLSLEANSWHNFGYAQWQLNQLTEAETSFRKAISLRDQMRQGLSDLDRVSLFDTQLQSYPLLRRVLVAQKKYESALEVAEAERARAFVRLLATRLSSNSSSTQALEQRISPLTIEQIKQVAQRQNATLVEYSFIADENFVAQGKLYGKYIKIHIWVVKPTGEVTFRTVELTPQQADLIKQAGNWANQWQAKNIIQNYLNNNNQTTITSDEVLKVLSKEKDKLKLPFDTIHRSLHEVLITPIADLLPTNVESPIIFIPQQELFQISFPALQDNSGTYLIEKHSILTAPTIQVLQLITENNNSAKSTNSLVIGNPTNPTNIAVPGKGTIPLNLTDLPSAKDEAINIAQILNTEAIIGSAATETLIKQKINSSNIIHFATHGLLDDFFNTGIPGAISFAESNNDDGLLTSSEILDLRINADLVVISACDTGRGLLTRDGVLGLSRSLFLSGASNLVLPLWEVRDISTASLMTEFHQARIQLDNKAQALRQAMLATMKSYSHPTDWAAFTLIGQAN